MSIAPRVCLIRCRFVRSMSIHPTAIIDPGASVDPTATIWHYCHIVAGAVVGADCSLGQNVVMMPGSTLGRGCRVQNNVSLYTGVICQEEVFLGPSCVFTNVINPRAFVSRKDEYRETLVERGASIGANATILCGVRIGAYALIGAGAVVTHDVAPYALVYGAPARLMGWVSRLGHKLSFVATDGDMPPRAVCPESGEVYELRAGRVVPMPMP